MHGVYEKTITRTYDGVELEIMFSVFQKESIVENIKHKGVMVQDLLDEHVIDWAEQQAEDAMLDEDGYDEDTMEDLYGENYGGTD